MKLEDTSIELDTTRKKIGLVLSVLMILIWLFLPIIVQKYYDVPFIETAFLVIIVYYIIYYIFKKTGFYYS
ncbi:MAG: hypothetical protein ABEJ99_03915 [Candidatus Nanohaloarchaea archaeon]